MKIVVCDDDALVYEQMKNIIASYSIVKNENLELTFYQTVEEYGNISVKFKFADELRRIAEYIEINTTQNPAVAG